MKNTLIPSITPYVESTFEINGVFICLSNLEPLSRGIVEATAGIAMKYIVIS